MNPPHRHRLDSWKAIAQHFGRDVRTVTRWATHRGLPIRRVPGGKRGSVYAFTDELDGWLLNQQSKPPSESSLTADASVSPLGNGFSHPAPSVSTGNGPNALFGHFAFRRRLLSIITATLIIALGLVAAFHPVRSHASEPFTAKLSVDSIEADDSAGHRLWIHRYSHPIVTSYFLGFYGAGNSTRVADFLGDGNHQVLVVTPFREGMSPDDPMRTRIDFFSNGGRLLWSYTPRESFRFGNDELKGPWFVRSLFTPDGESHSSIWAAIVHHTWGNGFVVQIDPRTGKDTLRFVNSGTLYKIGETKTTSGKYLFVGGFNNEWDGGSLAIFNEERAFAASPQMPGTHYFCNSCPVGSPDYYFVFPRTEINRLTGINEDPVLDLYFADDGIQVRKFERFTVGTETTIYLLSSQPPFNLVSLHYNSSYDALHREWNSQGKLRHSLANCPERIYPVTVKLWTPTTGWKEITVQPTLADR
jgi:hypothetical protein